MLRAVPIGYKEQNYFVETVNALPMFYAYAIAGFPNPSDDYPTRLDLNKQLIKNPSSVKRHCTPFVLIGKKKIFFRRRRRRNEND